jgi:hypothetical protein
LWKRKAIAREVASFSTLNLLLEDENFDLIDVQNITVEHLGKLIIEFYCYILQGDPVKCNGVCISFSFDMNDLHDVFVNITKFQDQLIEVQSDETLHCSFNKHMEACLNVKKVKPILENEVLKVILPFSATYLGKSSFLP